MKLGEQKTEKFTTRNGLNDKKQTPIQPAARLAYRGIAYPSDFAEGHKYLTPSEYSAHIPGLVFFPLIPDML